MGVRLPPFAPFFPCVESIQYGEFLAAANVSGLSHRHDNRRHDNSGNGFCPG